MNDDRFLMVQILFNKQMINRFSPLVMCYILMLNGNVFSQQNIDSPLTFKEAVKIALDNNNTLKRQRNDVAAFNILRTSSLLQMGPSLSITGNTGRNDGNSFNQQEGRVVNGILDFTHASLTTSMPLFQGFNQLNSYKASKSLLEAQVETVERSKQDVIQLVASRYLQCLLDRELMKIARRNVETQQKQLEQINVQVDAGTIAEVDAVSQEYQLKNAELNLLRAQNKFRNDKVMLAQTLQLDPGFNFELLEPAWGVNDIDKKGIPIDELSALALENRSDLERSRHLEAAFQFNYIADKGNYYPSIYAFFNYGSAYNYIHKGPNRTFDQQFTADNVQKTYGISFNIPIFNGLKKRANVVRSKVDYQNAQLDVENQKMAVKSEVLLAHQKLKDAVITYEVTQTQLKAAELSYALATERYQLGISNLVEYTQANQDYTQAQADWASARYTLMFQQLLMDYATGTLTYENIR